MDNTENNLQPIDSQNIIKGLNGVLAGSKSMLETLDAIVGEASRTVNSDHVFLSRYDASSELFKAIAWRSTINPSDVSLEQKFMGATYFNNQAIVLNDLAQYNYRLRPAVARIGFLSMVGIPLIGKRGVIGVLEAFAEEADRFTDFDVELMTLYAGQAVLAIEQADIEKECQYQFAENKFIKETLEQEQASIGSILFRVGETFSKVLKVDGITVFGVDHHVEGNPLQEVQAEGFSMADINKLKNLFHKDYLTGLINSVEGNEPQIYKRSLKHIGAGNTRLLYILPIAHKKVLHGIVVFYWDQMAKEISIESQERFLKRIIGDVTFILERKHLYNNIQKMSFFDATTSLANRRLFNFFLERELKKIKRNTNPLSLLMIDLDYFKNINDAYGHPTGDKMLADIGEIIKGTLRNKDLPSRYGGEEFAIVLPDTDRDEAMAIAERLREKVARYRFNARGDEVNITISVGGVTYNKEHLPGAVSAKDIVAAADGALYQAKQLGRNISIFAKNPLERMGL
jgi:diguanylate cyclase (GGDEF)-like protein